MNIFLPFRLALSYVLCGFLYGKKTYSDTFRVSFFIHNNIDYLKYLLYIWFLFEKLNAFFILFVETRRGFYLFQYFLSKLLKNTASATYALSMESLPSRSAIVCDILIILSYARIDSISLEKIESSIVTALSVMRCFARNLTCRGVIFALQVIPDFLNLSLCISLALFTRFLIS